MKLLDEAGLVASERKGSWVYYALEPAAFRDLATVIQGFADAAERRERDAEPETVSAS